ncbi:MAG: hypothetical protein AUJ57_01725 [Zetaproteobacteria bacterium CG1_02_53_45]|nr:MAG: hypothetical protein AUJ57_01725 [Zetaproteobacteria bacterium CG1_02_53_45]
MAAGQHIADSRELLAGLQNRPASKLLKQKGFASGLPYALTGYASRITPILPASSGNHASEEAGSPAGKRTDAAACRAESGR